MSPLLRHAASTLRLRLAAGRRDWRDTTLWALDLETGGLDPDADSIVSLGMVPVRDGAIVLADAVDTLVRPDRVPATASLTVHHILPADLDDAPDSRPILADVADRVDRGVLLVHQRAVDVPFLRYAFRAHGITAPVFLVIDTVDLLRRYARRHGLLTPERPVFPTALADARARFGLPPHRAHEALSDAIATAELFLVLAHRLRANRLGSLL